MDLSEDGKFGRSYGHEPAVRLSERALGHHAVGDQRRQEVQAAECRNVFAAGAGTECRVVGDQAQVAFAGEPDR